MASVSGAISGSTTWTAAGGPYQVTANVTIGNGATLTIQRQNLPFTGTSPGLTKLLDGCYEAGSHELIARIRWVIDWGGGRMEARRPPEDPAILVVSFDAYQDLWPVFFQAFFKYWPDCPYRVYLGANTATYVHPRVQGPYARCYLKSAVPPAMPNGCCISGYK